MNGEIYRLPRYKDIPDVGLLLDQVARLVNSYLEPYQDIRLTNSMISNYVKHDIIARPIKKLYYREQIASLVFIAVAKTVLSLDDIVTLLTIQRQNHTPDAAYNMFCDRFEQELYSSSELAGEQVRETGTDSGADSTMAAAFEDELGTSKQGIEENNSHVSDNTGDSYLLYGLIKAVADCIRLKELLAARR